MSSLSRFIIRVYGFLVNEDGEVLIAEEYHYNTFMRKFPGGGLELGEGPVAGLKRELYEELQLDFEIGEHIHTTDFFSRSLFNEELQVIGIYYLVQVAPDVSKMFREPYQLPEINGVEKFRWVKIDELSQLEITFPTDRYASRIFVEHMKNRH